MVIARPALWLLLALTLLGAQVACAMRGGTGESGYPASPSPAAAPAPTTGSVSAPAAPRAPVKPAPRQLPAFDREPTVGVLLSTGPAVSFTLLVPGQAGGRRLAPGTYRAALAGGEVTLNGESAGAAPLTISVAGEGPRFSATLVPPFGKPQSLRFAGEPVLLAGPRGIALIERIPLEGYLAGVVGTEMTPTWPLEALKAQAIAARSYAASRWVARFDRPWQLHWHYSVDMAYAGVPAKAQPKVAQALAQTRGSTLMYRNLPVPALFHASSGGATENVANVWGNLTGADGVTAMGGVMPSVADPANEAGCKGLKQAATHWRWKSDIPLSEITTGLKAWAAENNERPQVGTVTQVATASRFPDSGRVATLTITHKLAGKTTTFTMPAHQFRMAVSPLDVPSTFWDRCVMAKGREGKPGLLVLAGRGFGHGVGLSQVSAWQMAKDGIAAAAITARFYPGATLTECYR
jgi:SpoIID/LytB domain protein